MPLTRVVFVRIAGIAVGLAADAALGDPRRGHPVALFGRAADALIRRTWRDSRPAGAAFGSVAIGTCVGLGWTLDRCARRSDLARLAVLGAATWTALGTRSLSRAGTTMQQLLDSGDLDGGRHQLRSLCARDPQGLGSDELARATVESLAENASDATVAPLVWALVGGPAGVLGYRAANTLDAMVGYRNARYERFGWFCARFDDLVNLVPARLCALLTVACAPLVDGRPGDAMRVWRRDASAHPSPNAGHPESAFAGALGVRLGGTNTYPGYVESRPTLGDGRAVEVPDIGRAARLSRLVGLATFVTAASAGVGVAAVRRSLR